MSDTLRSSTLEAYPEISDLVRDEQWDEMAKVYRQTAAEIQEWMEPRIKLRMCGNRAVRMLIDRPGESDNRSVFFALGEFGNGLTDAVVARALATRNATTPGSTLIVVPNDTYDEMNNLDLTQKERRELKHGSEPITERLLYMSGVYDDVTLFGPSQGASVGAAFASHKDSPEVALAAIEPPNVVKRNLLRLGKDFAGSAAHLADNIRINDPELTGVAAKHLSSLRATGTARYGLGLLLPSNVALQNVLRTDTFQQDATIALEKGSSVAHVWAEHSLVSPTEKNHAVAYDISEHPRGADLRYFSQVLSGEYADHSMTNVAGICVAAVARALELRQR